MAVVTNVTSFGRSGLYDWAVQRVSAVILGVYFVGMLAYLVQHPDLSYTQWHALFSTTWVRIVSLLVLISLCAHAWVGLWTISTDYLTTYLMGSKATVLRLLFQAGSVALMFIYLVWGIQILWGV